MTDVTLFKDGALAVPDYLKTADADINEVMSAGLIINQVKEIDNILNKRTTFIDRHK